MRKEIPSYKSFGYVVVILYLFVALLFVLIISSVNDHSDILLSQQRLKTKHVKIFANPVTDNDTVSLLRLDVKNATIDNFIPSSNAIAVGVCDNGRTYTESTVCVDIAKSLPFEEGDFLGELTLTFNRNVIAEINSADNNGYFENNRLNKYKMTPIIINDMDILPMTGSIFVSNENRNMSRLSKGICSNADVDNNNKFDHVDLSYFAAKYGMTCVDYEEDNNECGNIDFNNDGFVDYMDFAVFVQRYHNVTTSCKAGVYTTPKQTPTPEKSSAVNSVPTSTKMAIHESKTKSSMECLINKAVESLNKSQGGYYVSPEILYSVLYGETKFWCDNSGSKICNSGDPNQVSTISSITGSDDGLSISQALSYVANDVYKKYEKPMYACLEAIGVNYKNAPSYSRDGLSINQDFSRKRVGDSVCLAGLLLQEQGKSIGYTELDRKNIEKSIIIAEYYTCPSSIWCEKADLSYKPMLSSLIQNDTMGKCSN